MNPGKYGIASSSKHITDTKAQAWIIGDITLRGYHLNDCYDFKVADAKL